MPHLLLLCLWACTPARVEPEGDGGSADGGTADGGTSDGGSADGGTSDGGASDGGTADGGASDGGTADGGGTMPLEIPELTVEVHPEISTLLVATWTQSEAVEESWLTFTFEDQVITSPSRAREPGEQREVLLGVPAETEVSVSLSLERGAEAVTGPLVLASTAELPSDLVVPELVQWDEAASSSQRYALTAVDVGRSNFYGPFYVVILDRQGRVVWYESVDDSRLTWQPRPSLDGTHLVYEAATVYVFTGGVEPSIKRLTLDLEQEEETFIDGFGLAWAELPDGGFVFDHAESGYEFHVETLSPDGERERIWSCYPWMSAYDRGYWACAPNAIVYDPDRNTVIYSMFETSTVVEVDLDSGELLRHFGQIPDGYAFDPGNTTFDLQHYPNWTASGSLLVSTHQVGVRNRQFVREFEVDEANQTLVQTWSYDLPPDYYAEYAGGALRLDNGNTMITVGTDGAVLEITPEGEIVWELDWAGHLVGNVLALDDLYALNQGW